MKKFNQLTERQMSKVNGGSALWFAALLFMSLGGPGFIGSVVGTAVDNK